jgi:hypothetical protein
MNRKMISKYADKTDLENIKEKVIKLLNNSKVNNHVTAKISAKISNNIAGNIGNSFKSKVNRRMSFTPINNKSDINDMSK